MSGMHSSQGSSSTGAAREDDGASAPSRVTARRGAVLKRLMAQGEREKRSEEAERASREADMPLCQLVPMRAVLRCREIAFNLAKELPQDISEVRMARLRMPKNSTQVVLREGATVEQAATHAALKMLEGWVRVLRPFASDHGLGELVCRIVHLEESSSAPGWEETDKVTGEVKMLEILPKKDDPMGAAIRRVVPNPEMLKLSPWEWMEDYLSAQTYEANFDRTSFVHRTSTPAARTMRSTGDLLVSSQQRPATTGLLTKKLPDAHSQMRLSAPDFPWHSFNKNFGFRTTATDFKSEKYVRSIPGPAVYSDYHKLLAKPQTAGRATFHSVGDRRGNCITTPLMQLDRFFSEDYRIVD